MPEPAPVAWPGWPYQVTRAACYGFLRGVSGLRIRGQGYVPAHGPAVLMANHESYFDPYLVSFVTWRPVQFMAKIELFSGFGGWLFPRLNTAPVKRGQGDLGAFRNAWRHLSQGRLLGIFPEGTRSADGRLQAAQPGAVSIALRAGVPIVPVAISGTFQLLPRQGGLRLVPVAVAAGQPLRLKQRAADAHRDKELLEHVGEQIMARIAELRAGLEQDFGTGAPGRE